MKGVITKFEEWNKKRNVWEKHTNSEAKNEKEEGVNANAKRKRNTVVEILKTRSDDIYHKKKESTEQICSFLPSFNKKQ